MPRATRREITTSVRDHAEHAVDVRQHAPRRHAVRHWGTYTSDASKDKGKRPMFNRKTASATDKAWRALGKQVAQGPAVRLSVRF